MIKIKNFALKLLIFCILFTSIDLIQAQTNSINDLAFYADVLTNAAETEHRKYANEKFKTTLDNIIDSSDSFDNDFKDIPWLFVRYNPTKDFRILSWQLKGADESYIYYTIFQEKDGSSQYFSNSSHEIDQRQSYSLANSYSAIFHEIVAVDDYFLLLAYRQIANGLTQKICDVLTFNNRKPIIGKSIFYQNESIPSGRGKKRVIMTYSSVASASMNVNIDGDEKAVVFDHIISVPGKETGQGLIYVPDGIYEAYEYKSAQLWIYNPNLYAGLQYNPKTQSKPPSRKRN
ncbi:MAG: hypothetical protein V3V00_01000 [Saprospiraceae bacterium]